MGMPQAHSAGTSLTGAVLKLRQRRSRNLVARALGSRGGARQSAHELRLLGVTDAEESLTSGLEELETEADRVRGEGLEGGGAVGEAGGADGLEGVDGALVAADAEDLRVLACDEEDVGLEVGDAVLVGVVALVPVVCGFIVRLGGRFWLGGWCYLGNARGRASRRGRCLVLILT